MMPALATETDFSRSQMFRPDWLALAPAETALDPSLGVIDAHAHLWDRPTGNRYLVEDFAKDIHDCGHRIEATIYVECNSMYRASGPARLRSVGETEFAVGQAAMADSGRYTHARIAAAIVCFVDLTSGEGLRDALDAQIAAGAGRVRGVRQRAKWDAHIRGTSDADRAGLYLEDGFVSGVVELGKRGLLFEASIYHPQIPDVVALARRAPDTQIVVNHSGSPLGYGFYAGREREVHETWLSGMRELARCPNVAIKLGGMVMSLAAFDFGKAEKPISSEQLAALWRHYTDPCIALFGARRCMASSNFPVEKVACSYGTMWNTFKRLLSAASEDERCAVLSGTASRLYRV
jgi:L-fuconolactonase